MKATYHKYILDFKLPSGTSRGVLTQKETWFIVIEENGKKGIGECGILRGLSADDRPDYEEMLRWTCNNISMGVNALWESLTEFPSIQFGVEMAFNSLEGDDPFLLFPSEFTSGAKDIPINGLIWMGTTDYMRAQIDEKLQQGFSCIKLKIGALDFKQELEILSFLRSSYPADQLEIRVDANGGFTSAEALDKLLKLSEFELHSIEQPIQKNQSDSMSELCRSSPIPIALDEELIGVFHFNDKENLLRNIQPQYIILKPSFVGGIRGTSEWIALAEKYNIGWWITSALESNIGLNAIAQWTHTLENQLPQGLGTGGLFTNNIDSPLVVSNGALNYRQDLKWNLPQQIRDWMQ
ncbi:MAG TPA: o-succinylbenzoate synthase [Flavobacterium sp.]|nr:o-succinylbenzoate synthase [Flavobacterium sp.]